MVVGVQNNFYFYGDEVLFSGCYGRVLTLADGRRARRLSPCGQCAGTHCNTVHTFLQCILITSTSPQLSLYGELIKCLRFVLKDFSDDVQCMCLTMSLDIMFLTNDNLRKMRKEPLVLGLRYRVCSLINCRCRR